MDGRWERGDSGNGAQNASCSASLPGTDGGPIHGERGQQEDRSGVRHPGLSVPTRAPHQQLAGQMWSSEERSAGEAPRRAVQEQAEGKAKIGGEITEWGGTVGGNGPLLPWLAPWARAGRTGADEPKALAETSSVWLCSPR